MYVADIGGSAGCLGGFWLARVTGTGALIGHQILGEINTTVTGPTSGVAMDALIGVAATARLAAVSGNTDGMFAVHAKVYASDGGTIPSGARAACLHLDTSFFGSNINSGALLYSIYALNDGGYPVTAFARLLSASGGKWTNLFSFNFTNGTDPLVANTVFTAPQTVAADGGIRIDRNGTPFYIPYYAAA
jgi:hypothetical protein